MLDPGYGLGPLSLQKAVNHRLVLGGWEMDLKVQKIQSFIYVRDIQAADQAS